MGMYDIIEGIPVYCPQCGKIITNSFHTKDFVYPAVKCYAVGDRVPTDREDDDFIEIHSICENCALFVSVYINIRNDTLTNEFN